MNIGTQRACAWCGVAFMATFLAGFLIAGFYQPSPAPGESAHDMAQYFRDHQDRIRAGLIISMFSAALLVPWCVSIGIQVARIEGGRYTPLAWTQTVAGGLFALEFIIPYFVLITAAYRTERSDESIQLFIDFAWLTFFGLVSTLILQGVAIGVAVLRDRRRVPIFPRWAGYFCIWAVVTVSAGCISSFFQEGPFTWQGAFVWWMPLPIFGSFMIVTSVLVLRALKRQEEEQDDDYGYASAADVAALRRELALLRDAA